MRFPETETNSLEYCINYFKQNFLRGQFHRFRIIFWFFNSIFSPEKDIFPHPDYFFKTTKM